MIGEERCETMVGGEERWGKVENAEERWKTEAHTVGNGER